MQDRILTLFFLTACTVSGIATQQERCPSNTCNNISNLTLNDQYSIHFIKKMGCIDERKPTKTKPVTTVGTNNTKIIYSPGFIRKRPYPNRIFVEYSINCSGSEVAFYNLSYFHLQGKDCERCSDFITVDRGDDSGGSSFGTTSPMCGNSTNSNLVLQLQEPGNFRVKFHTSQKNRYPGFEMYIICYNKG
jgi:hypothetical protein